MGWKNVVKEMSRGMGVGSKGGREAGGQWPGTQAQGPCANPHSPTWAPRKLPKQQQRGRGARGRGLLSELH